MPPGHPAAAGPVGAAQHPIRSSPAEQAGAAAGLRQAGRRAGSGAAAPGPTHLRYGDVLDHRAPSQPGLFWRNFIWLPTSLFSLQKTSDLADHLAFSHKYALILEILPKPKLSRSGNLEWSKRESEREPKVKSC